MSLGPRLWAIPALRNEGLTYEHRTSRGRTRQWWRRVGDRVRAIDRARVR